MTTAVEKPSESKAMSMVTERLVQRFPHVSRDEIDTSVSSSHHRYDGSRVRDFVPILVEREVVEQYRQRRRPGASAPV